MTDLTNEPVSGLVERVRYAMSFPLHSDRALATRDDALDALAELQRRLDWYGRTQWVRRLKEERERAETAEALVGELRAGMSELLSVAERIRGGDTRLDPEEWYAARDYTRAALAKAERDGEREEGR